MSSRDAYVSQQTSGRSAGNPREAELQCCRFRPRAGRQSNCPSGPPEQLNELFRSGDLVKDIGALAQKPHERRSMSDEVHFLRIPQPGTAEELVGQAAIGVMRIVRP